MCNSTSSWIRCIGVTDYRGTTIADSHHNKHPGVNHLMREVLARRVLKVLVCLDNGMDALALRLS